MKNILTLTALIMVLPFLAMKPVSDSDLAKVTGQAGISISPDITMNIGIGALAWGDPDGINPACPFNPWPTEGLTGGGYIGINNFIIPYLRIRLRDNDTYNGYNSLMMKPVTIDVATGYKPYSGCGENTAFVRISPGAMRISTSEMQFEIALGRRPDTKAVVPVVLDQVLGVLTLAPIDMYLNPKSYIDVSSSHAGQGVTFEMNTTVDHMKIPFMSWGSRR